MAWGCGSHTNTVGGHEIVSNCAVVLGRARVASSYVDRVTVRAVEDHDRVCSNLEGCPGFFFYGDGMKTFTKAIAKEEEAGITANG